MDLKDLVAWPTADADDSYDTHTSQIPGDTLWHPAVEVSNSPSSAKRSTAALHDLLFPHHLPQSLLDFFS